MPSMSYCKFENTEIDMSQCVTAMLDANNIDDLDMNEYEQVAFRRLYDLCQTYCERYRDLAAEFIDE